MDKGEEKTVHLLQYNIYAMPSTTDTFSCMILHTVFLFISLIQQQQQQVKCIQKYNKGLFLCGYIIMLFVDVVCCL